MRKRLLKNGPTPASFSFIFGLFRTNNTIFTINQCENMSKSPSSIQRQDSNPQPFEHELSPITTRPGLQPLVDKVCATSVACISNLKLQLNRKLWRWFGIKFARFKLRTLTVGGRITEWLASSFTGLESTEQENMLLFVCRKAIKSKPVKQETSSTVILSPTVSDLWSQCHEQILE